MSTFRTFLLVLAFHSIQAQQLEWTWKDADGKVLTRTDLDDILREHKLCIESNGQSGTCASLSHADLHGAKLREVYLVGLDLRHTDLHDSDLSYAHLFDGDLRGADLHNADLSEAHLQLADLRDTNMSGTKLGGANLTGANLRNAELANADFFGTDLDGVEFEPNSIPALRGIAASKSLPSLTYVYNPDALFQLRKQFQDGGFLDQERKITYALKKTEAEFSKARCTSRKSWNENKPRAIVWSSDSMAANCGSFVLNQVFFDWTCQYGMSPGRPIILGILLWFLCSALYFAGIRLSRSDGLYRVCDQSVERISPPDISQVRGVRRLLRVFWREWAVLRTAMFFSLMSAFNIGFHDINFGRWLRLLTRQEFDIKAVGWVRVIAGWQSLVSVFLLALWVLTYFGRPFE